MNEITAIILANIISFTTYIGGSSHSYADVQEVHLFSNGVVQFYTEPTKGDVTRHVTTAKVLVNVAAENKAGGVTGIVSCFGANGEDTIYAAGVADMGQVPGGFLAWYDPEVGTGYVTNLPCEFTGDLTPAQD